MQTSAVEELETVSTEAVAKVNEQERSKVTYIPISEIVIDARLRELNDGKVAVLADSIKVLGVMQPIVVARNPKTGKYHLVAGRHRMGACELLGHTEIPAIVKDYSPIDKELAEIDENLCRFDLTQMERSIQVTRRKEIYQVKFPQTLDNKRRAELRAKWEAEGKPTDDPDIPNFDSDDAKRTDVKSFVKDTSEKTGRSTTQIRDEALLGEALKESLDPEVRDLIAPTPSADNKSDLKRLVAEPDEDIRRKAAEMVRASYDKWIAGGRDEKEKSKILKLGDALNELQKSPTYESTVSESGEDTLHKTLQKTLKSLEISVGSTKFKEVAETWTYEGLDDIRGDFYRIEKLTAKGIKTLTEIMDKMDKLGKGA
jgi:ParB/RepB/Spo0J family partition protein